MKRRAHAYLLGHRLNFMAFRRSVKPPSSFVGGKALRAQVDVWQDGHEDALRVDCGLDTMSDVNLALAVLLHDIHDIIVDDVRGSAGKITFAKEGTLKLLYEGEVAAIQAKVRALLGHEGVFEGRQVTMPKPFQAEPVELKFIDNPVPQSVPEPQWTFAQRNVLTQWAEAGLKDGSLELSTSRWAS
jgi:hypothetical protein